MDWSRAVRGTRGRRALAGVVPLLAALSLLVAAPASGQAAGLTATFAKGSDWGSGFIGHYTIRNDTSAAVQGWTLEFDLPAGERLASAWSAKLSSSGTHYVLTDEAWTHTIAPGESVEVGFQGAYSGQFAAPTECTLDGQPCSGGGSPAPETETPTEPAATEPLTATFAKTSDWGSGFVGNYVIRNEGAAPVEGWQLEFDLPSSETIATAWSAKLSRSGDHYTLTDESWTRTVAAGSAVEIGFQGTHSGEFAAPENCTLNGQPCAGATSPSADTTAPTAPSGLTSTGQTSSSVSLRWNAATDDVGVTEYRVYEGQAKVATSTSVSAVVTGLSPATSYTFSVRAVDAAGNLSAAGGPLTVSTDSLDGGGESGEGAGSGATAASFAPYVDMTLSPSSSIAAMSTESGAKHVTLAFIVSGDPCTASWGGYYGLDDAAIGQRIADLQAVGADPIVSFGGAINEELARTCTSVASLAAQYQAVIDQYGIHDLDFDIEGADQSDAASLVRRFKAIAQIQAAGLAAEQPVHVSLTLPVLPSGLTHDGLNVVETAIADGVDVGTVNVMAMDYFDPSLDYAGKMGDYAIQAATATHDQLAQLYPELTDAELWSMVGVTPMIGINDDSAEVFTTEDAGELTGFAIEKGLGRLAMWSLNRDAPCPAPTHSTSNTCSGVSDPQWAFSSAFERFGS